MKRNNIYHFYKYTAMSFKKRFSLLFLVIGLSLLILLMSLVLFVASLESGKIKGTNEGTSVSKSAQRIASFCQDKADWRKCYGDQLGSLNKSQKISDTLKVLTELESIDRKTMDCHLISHKIASSEVEKDPQNWLMIFQSVDQQMCMGGFVHGAMEGKKRFDSSFALNESTIPEICDSINKATKEKKYDACSHVIGHILLAEVGGDLKKGSGVCNRLPDELREPCNNGVFMENITRDNLVDHGLAKYIKFDDSSAAMIEETCRQYSGIPGTACWRELSHLYAGLGDKSLKRMWELCSRASNMNDRDECYIHAFNSILPRPDFDESQLTAICTPLKFDSKKYDHCYSWAIYNFMNNSIVVNNRAITLCSLASDDYRKKCFAILGQRLARVLSFSDRQNFCKDVSEEYKTPCSCPDCAVYK